MTNKNHKTAHYTVAIEVARIPRDVFDLIIDLKKWWPEDFEGESTGLNAEFVLRTGDTHYSKNKVIEFVPNKKVVWITTESLRKPDNYDWSGTRMIFEITSKECVTEVRFTYDGIVPENESERLVQICDMIIKERLYNLLNDAPG